jgi:hypothetical protein
MSCTAPTKQISFRSSDRVESTAFGILEDQFASNSPSWEGGRAKPLSQETLQEECRS